MSKGSGQCSCPKPETLSSGEGSWALGRVLTEMGLALFLEMLVVQ